MLPELRSGGAEVPFSLAASMPSAGNHSGFHFCLFEQCRNRAWARSIKKDQGGSR
jgi:hypothetical protein